MDNLLQDRYIRNSADPSLYKNPFGKENENNVARPTRYNIADRMLVVDIENDYLTNMLANSDSGKCESIFCT